MTDPTTPQGDSGRLETSVAVERAGDRTVRNAALFGAGVLLLATVYMANGGLATGNDCMPNQYLAARILDAGRLSFTPRDVPTLFTWKLETPNGTYSGSVSSWSQRIGPRSAEEWYADGLLSVREPHYYLTPSVWPNHYVGTFGIGSALAALPVFACLKAVTDTPLTERPALLWYGGKAAASLLVAGSVGFVFLTSLQWLAHRFALAIAATYALGTCVWSVSSQSLWQHGPDALFLSAAVYCLATRKRRSGRMVWAGACLGAAVLCRPDSALVAGSIAIYLLIADRKSLPPLLLGALPMALILAAYNAYYLGSPFRFGQEAVARIAESKTGSPDLWQTPFLEGLSGILLSPSRGMFVYSPFLVLSLFGFVRCWSERQWEPLRPLGIGVLAVWCLEAKHFDWWGGWSYGYRHIVDTAPLLAVLLVPIVPGLARRRALLVPAVLLAAWSIAVQFVGAFAYDVSGWNGRRAFIVQAAPDQPSRTILDPEQASQVAARLGPERVREVRLNIDRPQYRYRLWSWRDNQILYYLTHFKEARKAQRDHTRELLGPDERASGWGRIPQRTGAEP